VHGHVAALHDLSGRESEKGHRRHERLDTDDVHHAKTGLLSRYL
jgi:hypothetical protein